MEQGKGFDIARLVFQLPIPPEEFTAGIVRGSGYIGARQFTHALDESDTGTAGCDIAAIKQDVSPRRKGGLPSPHRFGMLFESGVVQKCAAQPQRSLRAVGEDMHGPNIRVPG